MFSFVIPLDLGRFKQFAQVKDYYDQQTHYLKEFVIPTRFPAEVAKYLKDSRLDKDVRLIPYAHEGVFNPAKALNLGVKKALYKTIIVTSPEVLPLTAVLDQLYQLKGKNVICQVYDETEDGGRQEHGGTDSLVSTRFRNETPAMYFLAMFNRADIYKINGWDEAFMQGYAYEDNDFGDRWVRAGLPFEVHDEIQAIHLYHPRGSMLTAEANTNYERWLENTRNNVIACQNGIVKNNGRKR